MKKYFTILAIYFAIIVIGLLFNLITGLIWPSKTIINVSGNDFESTQFVNEYQVRFLPLARGEMFSPCSCLKSKI